MRGLLLALVLVAALAVPASAATIDLTVKLDGEPVDGVNATLTGIDPHGTLMPTRSHELVDGSTEFEVAEGRYVVSTSLENVTVRKRVQVTANGTYPVTLDAGSAVAGKVLRNGESVVNVSVSLKDDLGTLQSDVNDANGSFRFSPVLLNENYTVEAEYDGYPFSVDASAGDLNLTVQVEDPISNDEELEYRLTNRSQLHSGRMTIVDFDSSPTTVHDYFNVHNPTERPFSGTLSIELPRGANVNDVTTLANQPLQHFVEGTSVKLNLSVPPGTSRPVGVHYSLPGNSLSLVADRYTDSVMLFMASQGANSNQFRLTGPLSMQGPVDMGGGRSGYVATANNISEGAEYGTAFTPSTAAPGTVPSNGGGDSGTETYLAVFLAVVVVAVLVYTRSGGKLPGGESMDLKSIGDSVGKVLRDEGGGKVAREEAADAARCPSCGTEAGGRFCPSCGTEMVHEEEKSPVSECPGCGAETAPGDAFCGNCGEAL